MNLFEKMGLVEREITLTSDTYTPPVDIGSEPVSVDASVNSPENVVNDIYAQNDLGDKSNSIFTVQALIETLPSEMTTAKKQSTVSGILQVSGKSVSELLDDASKRIETLTAARDKIVGERNTEISEANADIEDLKKAIEAANIKIQRAEEIINATKQTVSDEISIIDGLVEFCNGMEVNK